MYGVHVLFTCNLVDPYQTWNVNNQQSGNVNIAKYALIAAGGIEFGERGV